MALPENAAPVLYPGEAQTQRLADTLATIGLSETACGAILRAIALFQANQSGEIRMVLGQGGCRDFYYTQHFKGAELSLQRNGTKWSIT